MEGSNLWPKERKKEDWSFRTEKKLRVEPERQIQFGVCPNSGSMGLVCQFGEKNKCEVRPYLCTRIRMDAYA